MTLHGVPNISKETVPNTVQLNSRPPSPARFVLHNALYGMRSRVWQAKTDNPTKATENVRTLTNRDIFENAENRRYTLPHGPV